MPKFLNLISQSGKQEFVDVSEFNKNPNAYGKYKIRMVDDSTGKNYDIPAIMFGEAQKDGLRAWNMEKQTTKQKQVQNPQPKTTPSYQDMISGDYWSKQLGAKQKQDILPTQEKAGLDLPNLGGKEGYVDRTMDVLYNEQKRFAKSQAEMERIQKELGDANKRAEALKKQISEENQRRQDTAHVPTYGGFYAQLPQNSNYAKQLEEEQKNIAQLSKQLNENEYYQKNLNRLEETARGLSTEGALEAQQRDAQMPWYANPFMSSNQRVGATINQPNEKQRQASTILENVKQTRRMLREASLSDDSWYMKLGRGLADAARDINTWDSGVNAVNNALSTLNAKRGFDQGKATAADKAVLESAAIKNATSQKTKDAISAFYNAGITTTNMVPFMAQIVSSPFNNVGRGLSSAISKMLTQTAQGALLQRMLPQVVYRAAVNGMKGIGRFAGDVAGGAATALTFANQKMLADAANRYQGQHTGQFTADGRFEYTGSEKAKGKYQALLEAFATQAIEYQSELVGEYFTPLNRLMAKGLGKSVGYGTKEFYDAAGNKITSHFFGLPGHKISLDKTIDLFSRLSNAEMIQAFNKFTKATKFNGVIGEYLEEVVGNMENATLGINDANWGTGEGGVFNPKENMETFLAVAVGSGFMAGMAGPVGLMHKASINRAYNRANADGIETFNLSAWQAIRDQIDYAPVPELPNVVLNIMNGMNDNQKRVVQNYAAFSVAKQGSLMSEFKDQLERPHVSHVGVTVEKSPEGEERYFVTSSDEQYNVLQKREFKTEEEANAYVARQEEYIANGRNLQVLNQLLSTDDGAKDAEQIAVDMGLDLPYVSELFYIDPFRRSDSEQAIVDEFVNRANGVAYPSTEVNEPHETQNGQDLADGAPIGDQATIDTVNQREANAISHWNEVADPDLQNVISILTNQGNSPNDILEYLRYNDYSEDIISAFCELCNAKAEKDGFMSRTGQRIEEQVNQKVQQVTFAGLLNGEVSPIILQVQDQNGVPGASMYIVSGNISMDEQGTLTSDGLIILRDEQGNFIQRPDTNGLAIVNTQNAEDYRNQLLTQTQEAVTAQIQTTEYKAPEYNDSDMEAQAPETPQGSGLTAPQPTTPPADTNEQQEPQQEPEPAIPTDENGNLLYHKAPIEATILDLYNGELDDEEIRDFVQNKINESSKEYDKANKKKPKIGTDKNAYLQAKTQWQSQVDEAKQQLDYWNSVQNYIQQQTHTTPEEIKAAQDELSGTTARLEYARQAPEGATTPEQIAGEFVKNAKIQPEDFYRETGLTAADARKQYPGMLSNNGATIASLAEQLVQYDNDNYGGMFFKGDDMEARNYIIEALKNAPSRKSLGRNMTAEEQEYARVREQQREDFHQEAYGMSYSDYLAFEEQEMPNIWRRISNFAPEQYDQMVAEYYESLPEDYFTPQNEQQNGTEGQQDNGLADSTTVLPQPPTDNEAGSGQREDPAAETRTGSEGDNQNEEVPGGTQGVGQTREEDSLLPNSSDMHLAENRDGLPDLLPTQESNESISEGKDTTKSPNSQENQQKTDKKSNEGQQEDETAAAIKKDIEDFIAKSTHDVQITNYDEKEFEAQISVDGKPSNIVITPPMELGENMHAEYRPTEGGYQELGDLLDEYNEGLEPKEQGLAGEHLAAIFSSVDAAINFETWLNQKNNPNDWENLTEEQKSAAIDADTIADENAKELAKDFLRGDNTSTIAEVFYREIVGRYMDNEEAPKKKEEKPSKPKPSNIPPTGQAESGEPNAKPREDKPKTETPPATGDKSDVGKALDEFKDVMARFRQAGRMDANVSLIGLNARQIEMLGEVFRATAKLGYALIKSGTTTFENWLEAMKAQVSDIIKANSNWNDQDITELLTETWNNKYLADGVRKPLSQWAAEEALAVEQKQEKDQPAETPEAPVAEQTKAAERKFVDNVAAMLTSALETGEKPYASITALRKAAREAGMEVGENGETDIKIQELVEDALVRVARGIMRQARIPGQREIHKFRKETFEKIKLLYNLQPTISMRSSNRVALQQYSTPLPMAFVADMFANGKIMRMFFSALEPTAGNGMLVFGIDAKRVHVNEIDENRLENLQGQGFKEVTSQDATQPFKQDQYYDAIITNPPFGEAEAKDYDGYKISGLAPQIALNALSKMRDFGKAVIIIGGKQEFAPNGAIKNDKPFLTYLYNHYNVKGVIDMEGSLYAKQGTTFPTRMILIEGRRTEEERAKSDVFPPTIKDWLPKADSFDKLYDTVKSLMESKEKTNGTEIVHAKDESLQPDRGVTLPGDTDKGTNSRKPVQDVATAGRGHGPNRGNGKDSKRDNPELDLFGGVLGGSGGLSDKPEGKPDSGGGSGRRAGRDNGPAGEGVDNRLPVVNDVPGVQGTTTRGVGLTQEQEDRKLESEKLPYRPHNGAFSLESLAPAAMVEAMDKTLKRIEEEYGNIDEFVTNELGYDSVDTMHKALAAEQVDSVAMAIYNMKKGEALIIGDQTGVGKGRQMAALIRWAVRQGKKPIFMTQKSNLFNDIYRDLKDISSETLKPFIFNSDSDAKIVEIYENENGDEKQKIIYRTASEEEINEALKSGKIPDDCDFVLCTYSQISTGDETSKEYENQLSKEDGGSSKRRRSRKQNPDAKPKSDKKAILLRKLAKDNYLMLDESHTAAGESNQGFYMQTLVRDSKAVTFASATYAKRPDTMPLYALRTAMAKANIGMQKLIEAIQKGGVTLQEIMSRALTNAGQMVRRERDMEGVVTDWKTIDDPETVKKARENYDKTIKAFNAIIDFQNKYINAYIDNRRESLATIAGNAGFVKGTEKMGINNTPFASKTYNYTKQLMLALKVDAIVDEVDRQIKAGRKPVIALDNTMGALFDKLTPGEEVTESTFAENLLRGLDSVMQYSQDSGRGGKKTSIKINPSELGSEGEIAYYELVSFIKESTKDIFISPLDEITAKLRAKGYTVGELTGRKNVVVEDNGTYRIAKRGKISKQLLQSRFNSGKIDVVILNKTGSTGISLHASKTFADQRQRVMILAQPLPDINDYMQMIGRIDRTGQVKRGYYINLGLPVPAEQRFLMMLSTKLKSLNANTTTSQESKDNKVEAPDMLNKYGSQVIVEYFKDHPDVYNKLDDPLNVKIKAGGLSEYKPSYDDEDARKLTGQVALLSTDEQQAFYDDVIERYNNLIKYLDDSGTNDLKITSLPLNATTLARAISSVGNDPTGDNPFAQNAYVEKVEMDVLRKPMKASEIKTVINTINKGKDPKQAVEDIKTQYENEYKEKLDKQERKYKAELERNKETLKKFEDKINGNEKMPEEDKKKAIEEKKTSLQQDSERKNENAIGALEFDHERMVRDLDLFKVGSPYLIPDNLDSLAFDLASPGIFLGFKAKENGITPSSTVAVFATLDGRRRVEVKLSERGRLSNINETTNQNYDAAQEINLSNWDSNIPNITRKTGYIITGNILQAINDSQDENGNFTGQLVSYTDSEGNIHDGVLMPDKWEPTMLVNAGKPIASAREDIERGRFVRSINGEVEIYTDRHYGVTTILLRVPKSKKLGAKYYENEDLRNAIDKREFYQKSGKFQVAIPNGKLDEVLSVLSSLGVKVPSDVVKQLNENSQQDNNSVGKKYSEDNTINSAAERFDIMKGYNAQQLEVLPRYSYLNRNGVYVVGLKEYIERLRDEKSRYEKKNENTDGTSVSPINDSAESKGEGTPAGRYGKSQLQGESETNTNAPADSIGNADSLDKGRSQYNNDKSRRLDQLLAAAEAEDKKRISCTIELRDKYGIGKDGRISRDNLSKMLRDFTNNKDYIALFEKLMDDIEHLGIDIRFEHALGKAKGETSIFDRTVSYSLDYFARDVDDADKATVIIHELLHQELQSTIDAYNSVVFRGSLNNAQREAVSELNKIFDALKKEMPRNKNGIPFYGTKSVHEMVSELTDNEFREVLSNLQYNKKPMLQRIIDCIKRIIGLPVNEEKGNALDAASKAVQTLIENYNPSFDRNWRDKGKWIFDHIEGLANKLDYSLASEVDDKAILDKLNSEPTVKVYRAMQVIDGKLYPPMAAKVGGALVEPTKLGTWYQADEHPELIIQDGTYKDGTPRYVFKLDKGGKDATGKKATDVKAAYNPYWHTSRSPLNDQFKSAWIRPNLVTVEVEVPESELTSGYKAQYAKDSVGEVEWKSGSVSGKLAKLGNPRKVILSRYNKVVRVVPESEIADRISEMLSGTDITIPENVVTPKLRAELEKKDVSISEPEKGVNKNAQIEEALAAGLETDNSLRYRKIDIENGKAVYNRYNQSETQRLVKAGRDAFGASLAASYVAASQGAGRYGKIVAGQSEEEKSRMRDTAASLAKSLNTPIKIISVDEAPEGAKNSKGYYDTRTGEVTIVLDNNTSAIDVQRTVAHEVIGHKGLRGLLGKQNYYKIMNAVYDNLPQDEKDKINEAARRNGWQMYTAMDEYLAEQAENMVWDAKSASLWQNVKHYLAEVLRTLGFIVKPNLKDARYWLWLSKNQLKRGDVMSSIERNALLAKLDKLGLPEQKVEEQDHLGEPRYAFSNGNYVDSAAYDAIEQNLKSKSFYWKEAFIDYMQAYQVFQNEMAKGLKNGLMDNQNALIGENALTSAIEQQQSDFMRMQLKPLQDIIKELQPEFGEGEEGIRNIENYLMMKHGLERNRVLFMRDWFTAEASRKIENDGQLTPEGQLIYTSMYQSIWYEYTNGNIDEAERDKQLKIALNEAHLQYLNDVMSEFNSIKNIELEGYEWGVRSLAEAYKNIDDFINQHANFEADKQDKSGLTALKEFFSGNKYEDAAIIDQVQSYDDMIGSDMADKLMQAVQAVSQFALDEDYKNGLVTKEGYNRAKNMFRYYIPLRGFDETTMEDVYEYMTYSKGTGAKSLVHAKGRTSKAGSPLATAANMALNAIARGLRNQNKQRAYRLVNTWLKDNPTSVPPAIVTDLWVGLDASGNDTVFTPDITDDMTAEEIREEIEKFKDKMRTMEELGKATKVRSEASFRHRFSSDNHKNEHIVPLMINGKAKMIIFNGNPRPAQALRGDLAPTVNKEFGMDRIMGNINRVMAGAFTSYNPTFMVTNLLRDTGFANNNIAIKEGGEYYAKFLKNQASLLTKDIGKYAKLKWNYDKGIAPRNEMEQYFYEFMKNGGKTGFVNQHDIAKLEKLLAENNQNFSALNAGTVVAKYTVNAIKAANDRIENINRFAAYLTSRQMGRSVMRSIYDAKEVSVNFNRKGAAGNTGRTPNATANMKLAANLASFTRGAYLFFNAGVQGLNLWSKNFRNHTVKMASFGVGIPMLLGSFVIPMLNQILAEAAGDGDDDPYANLPEWTRRNNICIYLGNGRFLKIPLPIELRAFYGLGDIAAGYLVNEHLKSEKNVALDMGSQLTQILPVDFLGEGQDLFYTFTPDAAKPLIQIKTNTDWTGKPIYKDSEWNKYEPEYTKAFKNEFEPFVNLSKWINEVSGGSDHVKGSFDGKWNNPAIWHAVIQGYGGGAVMDVVRIGSLSRRLATMDSKGLTTKEVPIVKAILETPSEKTQYYRMLNKFYNYQEKNEKFKNDLKALGESASPLDHAKFLRHTNPNNPSREMIIWSRFRDYDKANKYINKVLDNPNLSEADREALEQQAVRLKVDLVKILDQIED